MTEEEKAAKKQNSKRLYLMRQMGEGQSDKLIETFSNKHRLAKWWTVAVSIDKTLPQQCYVIRGVPKSLADVFAGLKGGA